MTKIHKNKKIKTKQRTGAEFIVHQQFESGAGLRTKAVRILNAPNSNSLGQNKINIFFLSFVFSKKPSKKKYKIKDIYGVVAAHSQNNNYCVGNPVFKFDKNTKLFLTNATQTLSACGSNGKYSLQIVFFVVCFVRVYV